MFEITTISDDEIDYFDELGKNFEEDAILSFLKSLDTENKCSKFDLPDFVYKYKTTANIATQPSRFKSLLCTLESIEGQFDEIRIYLNCYTEVPEELTKYTTHIGKDLTDNGKFFWSGNKNEYYFTLDDDIIYPPDYVEKTLPLIGNRIVSYHGRRLTGLSKSYYNGHKAYVFNELLNTERKLDVVGTGVMAFNTNIFSPSLWRTENYKMTDLLIGLEAHLWGIPIVCLPREKNWLSQKDLFLDGIYYEFIGNESRQINFADMIQNYICSNIDLSIINYKLDSNSIHKLVDFIRVNSNEEMSFINLRSGNGCLINAIKNEINFKVYQSYDTDHKRVNMLNESIEVEFSDFKYLKSYLELEFLENSFILLDDIKLPKSLSTKIYQKMKPNSFLICHNIVSNDFPHSKIELKIDNNIEIDLFFYKKLL